MKINNKRIISIALATLIAVGSTGAYASSFKDVSKNHWAKSYIEKGEKLGFFSGYEDGTFRPESNVSRVQTILLSTRLLGLSQSEKDKALVEQSANLSKNNLPDWVKPELAVALSKGLINVESGVLGKLIDSKGRQLINTREEVTIYLVKAMGLEKEVEKLTNDIKLAFKDEKKITKSARPYVYLMDKYNIMNGDTNGNFKPDAAITRAEMSRVLISAQEYMENKKNEEEKEEEVVVETTSVSGTIERKFQINDRNYIVIRDSLGTLNSYEVNKESVLTIDGQIVSYNSLSEGLKVKSEVVNSRGNEAGFIKILNSETVVENYEGFISSIRNNSLTIEHVENGISKRKTYSISNDTVILLDNKEVAFSKLRDNDRLRIEVTNGSITRINAKAYLRDIEGVLKSINEYEKYIEVEIKDGTRLKYDLHKDVNVFRNDRSAKLSELRKGDKLDIRIEDEKVTRLDAQIVRSVVSGRVKYTGIGYDKSNITILNDKTNKEETYIIPREVYILLNNNQAKLNQINLGDFVEIKLEGEEVTEIDAQSTTLNKKHLGTISHVGRSYIEINLDTGLAEKIDVIISYDTIIEEESGQTIHNLDSLRKGDGVLITGEIFAGKIDASKIMRFSK